TSPSSTSSPDFFDSVVWSVPLTRRGLCVGCCVTCCANNDATHTTIASFTNIDIATNQDGLSAGILPQNYLGHKSKAADERRLTRIRSAFIRVNLRPLTLLRRSHSMATRLRRCLARDVPRPTAGSVMVKARTSMVDGFPYKEEVGGSNPSVPTKCLKF